MIRNSTSLWAALVFAPMLSVLCPLARAQSPIDPLEIIKGRWVYVGDITKLGLATACADAWVQYDVVGREVRGRSISKKDGKSAEKPFSYIVLYSEKTSIAMYMNDEQRRVPSGDRMIWIAVFESKDRFIWRAHGRNSGEEFLPWAQVRCAGG